jgi:hypothetical protein
MRTGTAVLPVDTVVLSWCMVRSVPRSVGRTRRQCLWIVGAITASFVAVAIFAAGIAVAVFLFGGKQAFGSASDLVGDQCRVRLGADNGTLGGT